VKNARFMMAVVTSRLISINKNSGIYPCIVQADIPMQMRARRPACGTNFCNHLATGNLLALANLKCGQMAIHGDQALSMIDKYGLAIEKIIGDDGYHAISGRFYRCTGGYCKIKA